jgi:aryl-alcohol dehydrogenase-like predicted oxidoreductase
VLSALAVRQDLSAQLREKLASGGDTLLPEVVLNAILNGTGIHVVIPAMMSVEHIHANVRSLAHSRFDSAEIEQIRVALATNGGAQTGE